MSSNGCIDGEVKMVVLTNGGTMRIHLHLSFVGFESGTVSAAKDSIESAPFKDAHFGTGMSWSKNKESLRILKISAWVSDPDKETTFSSGNTMLGPKT